MPLKYRAFISYKHADKLWAEEVNDRLTRDGFTCFFDSASLRAGDDWETQLLSSLMDAQHLIVLVSNKIEPLDWVNREIARFDAMMSTSGGVARRIIPILLDADSAGYKKYQKITALREANAYQQKVEDVIKTPLWERVIVNIEDALSISPDTIPVAVAVLALDRTRFDYLYDGNEDKFKDRLCESLKKVDVDLNQDTIAANFRDRYGDAPYNWRPFGTGQGIDVILDRLRIRINERAPQEGRQLRWEYIRAEFYTTDNDYVAGQVLDQLRSELLIVIVDPVSLHDPRIVNRLGLLDRRFEDNKTAILVFAPTVPGHYDRMLDMVKARAARLFMHFHEGPIVRQYAHCAFSVSNEQDIGRLLRTSFGPYTFSTAGRAVSTYLSGPAE